MIRFDRAIVVLHLVVELLHLLLEHLFHDATEIRVALLTLILRRTLFTTGAFIK